MYLWASAAVDIPSRGHGIGPTALAHLVHRAARHLAHRERYTIHLNHRHRPDDLADIDLLPELFAGARRQTLQAAHEVIGSLRWGHPHLDFTPELVALSGKTSILRLLPVGEWHPTRVFAAAEPLLVQCDASWPSSRRARAGIVRPGIESVSIDLSATQTRGNPQAEFLGLCLALLTDATNLTPLRVQCDETSAVRDARLLYEGHLPAWVYRSDNDLTLRITVTAMTAVRLRPVAIEHVPRQQLRPAHEAASYATFQPDLLHPKSWARKQGIPLSMYDKDRGLDHNGTQHP